MVSSLRSISMALRRCRSRHSTSKSRDLLVECRDLHRRNAMLIERKLDTIRGALHSLRTGDNASPLEVYDRLGHVARFSRGRGYQEA